MALREGKKDKRGGVLVFPVDVQCLERYCGQGYLGIQARGALSPRRCTLNTKYIFYTKTI